MRRDRFWRPITGFLAVELAIFSIVLPMAAVATFNYEFPSVVGGAIGLLVTIFLAKNGVGLAEDKASTADSVTPRSQSGAVRSLGEVTN